MLIIHGDNEIASRNLYISLKDRAAKSGQQIVDLSGPSLTVSDLVTASESVSLFGSTNSVFIEGFFTRRAGNDKKTVTGFLLSHLSADIYLWDSQDVSASLKSFPLASIKKFDLPKYIFQFIDTFSLPAFNQALSGTSPEQILALVARRIHDLILIKENRGVFPPWQAAKLKSQAAQYSLSRLKTYNLQLLELAFAQKTSLPPYDLATALQFWLAKNF